MTTQNVAILGIEALISSLGIKQLGCEPDVDPQLGFRMWGGKDSLGAVTKFLAKNKPGSLTELTLTGLSGSSERTIKVNEDGLIILSDLIPNDLPDHNDLNGLTIGNPHTQYMLIDSDDYEFGSGVDAILSHGLKIGNAAGTVNGTIRWTGADFEGRKGGAWVSLTSGGGGGGSASWGAISGTLSDQTDLNSALSGKEPTLTKGNLTESTSSVLTISGGTAAVIGSGLSIQVKQSSTSQSGYLSSSDWNTFNNKQSSLSFANLLGTTDQVNLSASGTGVLVGSTNITLSLPQSIATTSSPTFSSLTLGSSGLNIKDTNASHNLNIVCGSDLTANRIFTLTTGDSARTLTLSGNPTLDDWFDQSIKQASSPTFSGLTLSGLTANTWLYADGSKVITSASTSTYPSLTEFSYVKGLTSSAQTQINSLQSQLNSRYSLQPLGPMVMFATTSQSYTAGTPYYYYYPVTEDNVMTYIDIPIATVTSTAVVEVAVYSYAASGSVSRLEVSAQLTISTTGWKRFTLTNPLSLSASSNRYFLEFLIISGDVKPLSRLSGPSTTEVAFSGATSASSSPATQSTRNAVTFWPYMEPH